MRSIQFVAWVVDVNTAKRIAFLFGEFVLTRLSVSLRHPSSRALKPTLPILLPLAAGMSWPGVPIANGTMFVMLIDASILVVPSHMSLLDGHVVPGLIDDQFHQSSSSSAISEDP